MFSDLIMKTVDGGYELVEPMTWTHDEHWVTVPAGFQTDLASIPRIARFLFPGHGKTRKPAVLHDYLYANNFGTRKGADLLFRLAMEQEGMSLWRRQLAYRAVRMGGWVTWNRYAKEKQC